MHEAEQYLRNPETPNSLYVQYGGSRRRLFYNPTCGRIGMINKKCRKNGTVFSDWGGITKVLIEDLAKNNTQTQADREQRLTVKYMREAAKAKHTNPFIRDCLAADPCKGPYENHLTTGSSIDGQLISLKTIEKYVGSDTMDNFRLAIEGKTRFYTQRFDLQGYDGSLSVEIPGEGNTYFRPGDVMGYFNKEYRDCANGYYYLLINDDYFIGYDID